MKKIKSLRKLTNNRFEGVMVWVGPDNKAYKCNTPGMLGVKEMNDWNKKLKAQLTSQETLL